MFGAVPPLPLFAFMVCIGISVPFLVSLAVLPGERCNTFFPLLEGHPYCNLHVQICCLRSSTNSLTNLLPKFCFFCSLKLLIIWGHCFTWQLASPILHSDHCMFDVHVNMHCDKFLIINQPDAPISQIYFGRKLYMFWTVPLSIIRSFSLYTQRRYMSYRFFLTYTIAVCTVKNYWWWTEELSETRRVSF